jgi:lycopene beta-cyclase
MTTTQHSLPLDGAKDAQEPDCDLAIVGGGLAGGMIALAVSKLRPDVKILLIEEQDVFGGDHIWSFFASDIPQEAGWLIAPLIAYGWRGYDVIFPERQRHLDERYYSITSERFDQIIRENLREDQRMNNAPVKAVVPDSVALQDGTIISAKGVIDARGIKNITGLECGWQKFCGQSLQCSEPHGLTRPIIMDATVDQKDGYRFVYCLPFSPTEVFVEDTYYSDTPDLDPRLLRQRIAQYADEQGWKVERVVREETGLLPVTIDGNFKKFWEAQPGNTARAGGRSGLFHGLTSYSLPDAVRFALYVASLPRLDGERLAEASKHYAEQHWRSGSYYRMLSKMLFRATPPDDRYSIFQHFYRLPAPLLGRFYAGQSNWRDKLRILIGKPPIPIKSAMQALFKRS